MADDVSRMKPVAIATAACLVFGAASVARAGTAGAVFDLLRPGSHTAVGLGGDPFRSPLLDECGWWAEPGFSRAPIARVESYAGQPIAPRFMPGEGDLSTGEMSWRALGATRLAGRPVLLAGLLARPRFRGSFEAANGAMRFVSSGTRADGALRIESVLPGLSVQLAGPLWTDGGERRGTSLGAGLRWQATPSLTAQASWGRSREPEVARSDLYGQPIAASLNLRSERGRFDVRLTPLSWLALEGSLGRTRYAPLAPRGTAIVYQIEPGGTSRFDQATFRLSPARGVTALARWTRSGFDVNADLSWAGERFGQMNVARAESRSTLIGLQRVGRGGARVLLDVERVEANGRARVAVESWPFTPTLLDLLGLRWTGKAWAEARWTRLHAGGERALGRKARGRVGLGWYDIAPEARFESWRPMFLVFGRTDYREGRLDAHRVQLGAASLGFERPLGGLELALGVEQFVFAKAFETRRAAVPGAPSAGGAPGVARDEPANGWPGGTQIEFALSRRF